MNTRYQVIDFMKEYETKIFEELRFEDYCANRQFGPQGAVGDGIFGSPKTFSSSTTTTSTGLFRTNDNKPLFGATSTTSTLGNSDNEENVVKHTIESKTLSEQVLHKLKTIKSTENASTKQNAIKPLLDLSVGFGRAQ